MSDSTEDVNQLHEKRLRLARLLREQGGSAGATLQPSEGQRALWFLQQLAPTASAHNIAFTGRIVSAIDLAALRKAFDAVIGRHDALRTRIAMVGGQPVRFVEPSAAAPFEITDASNWPQERILAEISTEIRRPFDLAQELPIRVRLYACSHGVTYIAVTLHHVAVDGWSLWIVLSELQVLYGAAIRGDSAALLERAPLFSAYTRWESEMLADSAGRRHQAFWRQALSDAMPVINLPTDRVRPAVSRYAGAALRFDLEAAATDALRRIAQQERGTLQMAVVAVFLSLLQRYAAQDDLTIGYLASGRARPEFDHLVGYLTNALPLRVRIGPDTSFRELLRQTRDNLLDALDHQEYPFSRIVEDLNVARDPSRSPVFQTLFVFEKPHLLADQDLGAFIVGEPGATLSLGDLTIETLPFPAQREGQFDLTFVAVEREATLSCSLDYNTDLFDRATIERLSVHFRQLVRSATAAPEAPLGMLNLLSHEEIDTFTRLNDTACATPDDCFHHLFETWVARQPDADAVVFDGHAMTYAEVNAEANRLARHLRELGVVPDVIVGVCLERSSSLIVAVLAVLKAGGAFLPLDPDYPASRLAFMLSDADVPVLITQSSLASSLPSHAATVVRLDADAERWRDEPSENLQVDTTPDNLMYVIYTSGSTGQPKGVLLRHRGLVNVAAEQQRMFGVGPGSQVLQFAALSFDAAVFELSMALGSGGTLHMARAAELLPGLPLLDTLRRRAVNVITLPPSALMNVPVAELPHLKTITVAGEACPEELVQRWAGGRAFFNLYGPTEATIWSTARRCLEGEGAPTIGRPIANTRVYVLDRVGNLQPVGVPGELHIAGIGLARGYHRRPELSGARFVPDPFAVSAPERLYKTGDLVRWRPDGDIEFLGRIDHQVKVRGFRIELGEIESVIARHDDVHETVVVVREDVPGVRRVVAYVVRRPGAMTSAEALRAFVRLQLPEHMVPSAIAFLEQLPVSPAGKIDRSRLPAPTSSGPAAQAPASEMEQLVAAAWKSVLGVSTVGVDDNFFDLGGNSLLLAQVHARLSGVGDTPLSIVDMFQLPTVAALASRLVRQSVSATPASDRDAALTSGRARLRDQARRRAAGDEPGVKP